MTAMPLAAATALRPAAAPAADNSRSRAAAVRMDTPAAGEPIRIAGPLGWLSLARTTALRAANPDRAIVYEGPAHAARSPVALLQLALFDAASAPAAGGDSPPVAGRPAR